MRKILLLALLLSPLAALAQITAPVIQLVGTPPSGSCTQNLPDQQVATTGALYSCQSGTWTQIGSGGGVPASSAEVFNGVSIVRNYPGSTADVQLAAATADAINGTNGNTTKLVDASSLAGNQTFAATGVFGDSNNDQVGYIVPCGVYWTYTGSGGPGFIGYGGATIVSPCASSSNQLQFTVSSTSNPTYVFELAGGGNRPYFYGHGFQITNVGGGGKATTTGIGFYISGQFADGSTLDLVNVNDSNDASPEWVYGACCRFTQSHSSINAGWVGTPLTILTDSGNFTRDFQFVDGTIVHPGNGLPGVYCHDTRNSTVSSFTIRGMYDETGDTGTSAPFFSINGCTRATIEDVTLPDYGTGAPSEFAAISIGSAYNSMLVADNIWLTYGSGPWTYPVQAVVDNYTSQIWYTDLNGYFGHYTSSTVPSYFGPSTFYAGINLSAINQTNYLEGYSAGSGANQGAFNLSFYNPTAATSGQNLNGPISSTAAFYWNGSASAIGYEQQQLVYGSGSNPTETYEFTHGGSSGGFAYSFDGPVAPVAVQQGAAGNWAGKCTMTSTTCTVTLAHTYTTPICMATLQGTGTVIAGECSVSGTTATVTAGSSNTGTWAVAVFGDPN